MAKVINHTPNWLSRPSSGFQLFQPDPQTKTPTTLSNGKGKKIEYSGPCKTIAHRATEIFVLVGNEIRWSDLVLLRDAAGDQPDKTIGASQIAQNGEEAAFRASA